MADFTVAEFLEWARRKPADERYSFCSPRECALAQFGQSTGRYYLIDLRNVGERYPHIYNALNPPITDGRCNFGDLVKRLEALA